MKGRLMLAGALVAALSDTAAAQSCSGGPYIVDACRKAVDLVNFLTPQVATAQAGGNATLGQGGALGGFGRFAVDLRGTVVRGSFPKLDNVGFTPTASKTAFASADQFVPAVSANAAVGLWRGYSIGVTHVGGVDALLTTTYLQDVDAGGVHLKVTGGNWKFGYGARVGVLEESLLSPGVSLTWLRRDLPSISVTGTVAGTGATNPGGSISVNDFSVKTTAWRVTASKTLPSLGGLSAGVGQDRYESSSQVLVHVNGFGPDGNGAAGMAMTRTNMFLGVIVNVLVVKIVVEIGRVTGGETPTLLNDFGSPSGTARTYLTAGLRLSF